MATEHLDHPPRIGDGEKDQGFIEAHHRMPDGKLIAIMQVCVRCRRTFPPARGRKFCPCCQGLLRNKAIVLKIP